MFDKQRDALDGFKKRFFKDTDGDFEQGEKSMQPHKSVTATLRLWR